MELLSVGLFGYQRFEDDSGDMDVTGSPVAIVGPNEAGKTSFLEALVHLSEGGFETKNRPRGYEGETAVRARYFLDAADLEAIRPVGGIGTPRLLKVVRNAGDETRYYTLTPTITRDIAPRQKASRAAAKVLQSSWVKNRQNDEDDEESVKDVLDDLIETLDVDSPDLPNSAVSRIAYVSGYLRGLEDAPPAAIKLADLLDKLHLEEARDPPNDAAARILLTRLPRFLLFDPDWRQLESEFELGEGASAPMAALFELILFDLDSLRVATTSGDHTTVAELQGQANDAFAELFRNRWSQANLRVQIQVNGTVVHVYVRTANGKLIPMADRSAGLRQFIALLAFVESNREDDERLVLLVDEAEAHLHYDAQADLVNVFTRQTIVDKIIYTTHSAGCLPLDLGTGVRVIEPVGPKETRREDWERSRIRNAFWTDGPGFSPLLLAMGASSFAFAALRRAVVGEGPTEVILLPTLLREATDGPIDFQVAPGVSTVHPDAVRELDASAAHLAYIVDGDEGGLNHRQKLIDNGVHEDRIVILGGDEALAIEDVVDADLYLSAVNRVLSFHEKPVWPAERLGTVARKAAVKAWCEANGKEKPSEREVAQQILEIAGARRREGTPVTVLEPARRRALLEAHKKLLVLLALRAAA